MFARSVEVFSDCVDVVDVKSAVTGYDCGEAAMLIYGFRASGVWKAELHLLRRSILE